MFSFFKKSKPKAEIVDRDIQLVQLLKSVNLTDKTLGKVDELGYEVMDAEIEAIGLRMVERRLSEIERRRNGETLERQV